MSLLFDPVSFWLIMMRMSGLFVLMPGISDFNIPNIAKVGAVVWLTCFLVPQVAAPAETVLFLPQLLIMMVGEFALGAGLGLVIRMIFSSLQYGGVLMDSEMGLLAAGQLNPNMPLSGGVNTRFFLVAGMIYFWTLDFFPLVLKGLVRSFSLIPLGSAVNFEAGANHVIKVGASIFVNGMMLAAPVMAVTFLTILGLGFMAKAVQGINILFESFTIKLAVGCLAVIFFLPLLLLIVRKQLERILPEMTHYIQAMMPVS